ncbi:hypothetical protein [Halorubrum spindle-shaped virus-BLv25]|nr:hypothetical protein [Halorubrum spindle-shaped virus-BLv25]
MSKGSRRERELVELLKKAGMATYRPATVRFGENDMFGLFDVLALSPSHSEVYAIQVKSNRAVGIMAWTGHTRLFRELGFRTLYAVPVDNQGWRIIDCTDNGNTDIIDERDKSCKMGKAVVDHFRYLGDRL